MQGFNLAQKVFFIMRLNWKDFLENSSTGVQDI